MVDVVDSKSTAGDSVQVRVWGARGAPPAAEEATRAMGSGRNFASGKRAGNFGHRNRTPALAKRKSAKSRIHTCRCDGMVDVVDSKSTAGDSVPVRVRSPAPYRVFITDLTVVDTRFFFSVSWIAPSQSDARYSMGQKYPFRGFLRA